MSTDKILLTVEEAARVLSIGRTSVYGFIKRNELQAVKLGRSRRVVSASVKDLVDREVSKSRPTSTEGFGM
jgi:excisionase family DNA binding protein